jgi:hypothetical protein
MSDDLADLGRDLRTAAVTAPIVARAVVAKGALNIKNDWRQRWSGLSHARLLPYAVTYDTTEGPWGAEAEIGPDKDKPQGALGNLIEFGSTNNAPIPGGAPALDAEEPKFLDAMGVAAEKALGE